MANQFLDPGAGALVYTHVVLHMRARIRKWGQRNCQKNQITSQSAEVPECFSKYILNVSYIFCSGVMIGVIASTFRWFFPGSVGAVFFDKPCGNVTGSVEFPTCDQACAYKSCRLCACLFFHGAAVVRSCEGVTLRRSFGEFSHTGPGGH